MWARLAQSVEHQTFNLRVMGSSPISGALEFSFQKLIYHFYKVCIFFQRKFLKMYLLLLFILVHYLKLGFPKTTEGDPKMFRSYTNKFKCIYHRFRWYATLENKTLAETFPKFPSVIRVIDRSDRNPPITATGVTFWLSLRHASELWLVDFDPICR